MKASLTFTLPDEQTEYNAAVNGPEREAGIREFDDWLRSEIKYSVPETRKERERLVVLAEAREKLWAILNDRGIG